MNIMLRGMTIMLNGVPRRLFFATQQRIAITGSSSNIKKSQFQEEKISVRRKARSHVTSEKSSKKLYFLV
jgi:hypothetical protein